MSSSTVIIENPTIINGQISPINNKLNDLYSTYDTHSSSSTSSRSSSSSSLSSSNKNNSDSSTTKNNSHPTLSSNSRKESTLKLPYPVLSDHRDPASVLLSLQKETQTTSKKISDVIQHIEECEQRLTSHICTDNEKKTFKYERVKFKQQLDALKKHERRVSLQIDFMTTKTEIKGLEDEQKQIESNPNSDEYQQIKVLSGKLKQKLDKMKIYMRTRNEQMKKISNGKQRSNQPKDNRISSSQNQRSSSTTDSSRKRLPISMNNSVSNKRVKSTAPVDRLTSRDSKKHLIQAPIVRFLNKTSATNNSTSPTTPASSSSTLSPPLFASTSTVDTKHSSRQNEAPSVDDDEDIDLDLDIDELFNDDVHSEQTVQKLKTGLNELTYSYPTKPNA